MSTMLDTTSFMTSSISSLSSSWNQPPNVARTYKQAFQFFITRRNREALEVLEAIIRPPTGQSDGHAFNNRAHGEAEELAPVTSASRNARIKVWNLYISVLNAVVEMGAAEGKRMFGASHWTQLVTNTRDGQVWEDVVHHGYSGQEGNVDPEVVASLATLLIAHAPTQNLTQQRLETYLSTLSSIPVESLPDDHHALPTDTPSRVRSSSVVKELNARLKILEIFTLYVLPRNEEWDYAREFINMSEVLDEVRKEDFLQTLQALREQPPVDDQRESQLQKQRDLELEQSRREEERRKVEDARRKEAEERKRLQEVAKTQKTANDSPREKIRAETRETTELRATAISKKPASISSGKEIHKKPPSSALSPPKKSTNPPPGFYRKTSMMLQNIQQSLVQMGRGLSKHPMAILRTILFIVALLMALARRDVRDRLMQARNSAWEKLRRTVGMGVKVSYI